MVDNFYSLIESELSQLTSIFYFCRCNDDEDKR